jgi:hypothetical protein
MTEVNPRRLAESITYKQGQNEAEAELDRVEAQINVIGFTSRTAAVSKVIRKDVLHINVNGFTTAGDGGAASYRRVASKPLISSDPDNRCFSFRSADRFMPDGSTDNANGGWWLMLIGDVIPIAAIGGKGDFLGNPTLATDNYYILMAALNYESSPLYGFGLRVDLSFGKYYCSQTLYPKTVINLHGQGGSNAAIPVFSPTWIITPTDTTCIRLRSKENTIPSNGNSFIRGITWSQVTKGTNLNAHAIDASCCVNLHDNTYFGIAGDGEHIEAYTDGGGRFGEASNWVSVNNYAHSVGGNGHLAAGADTNIGFCLGFKTQRCGLNGIRDTSYFTNVYQQTHLAGYGTGGVFYNGKAYQPIGDSQNVVPGTNPLIWHLRGDLPAATSIWPTWDSTTLYRTQGPIFATAPCLFSGTYVEGEGAYGISHAPNSTCLGINMSFNGYTANLGKTLPGVNAPMTSTTGIGSARKGNNGVPIDAVIIGYRGDNRPDEKLSAVLLMESNGDRIFFDYEADGGIITWRGFNQTEAFGVSTNVSSSNGLMAGRSAPQLNRFYATGLGIKSTQYNTVRFFELGSVPTKGEYARGDRVFNIDTQVGGIDYWVCVQGGAIPQNDWVPNQFWTTGYVVKSYGKTWVVTNRNPTNSGMSLTAPNGSGQFVDPDTGLIWKEVTQPFLFVAKML